MFELRKLTRDLLLEYDNHIMPPKPRAAGLGVVYPWENAPISTLIQQLYLIAIQSGFIGTQNEFKMYFGSYLQNKEIIFDEYDNFPETGDNIHLYFDLNEKILYYWDNEYIPVNAMLITNTTINGGEA